MNFYCNKERVNITFTCNKSLKKHQQFDLISNDKSHKGVFTIVKPKDSDNVSVNCWIDNEEGISTLIFTAKVLYIPNHTYRMVYMFDKVDKVIEYRSALSYSLYDKSLKSKESNVDVFYLYEDNTSLPNYNLTEDEFDDRFSDDSSKLIFYCKKYDSPKGIKKEIKYLKKNNLIKTVLDKDLGCYSKLCEACHVPGSAYEDCSHGRVSLDKTEYGSFTYKGKTYGKVPENQWHIQTYWNVTEYEKVRNKYKDCRDFNKTWPEFEDLWENQVDSENKKVYLWRDSSGNISSFTKRSSLVIGAYERVVTKGWVTTPKKDTIECPVCKRISELNSIRTLNSFQLVKAYLYYFKYLVKHPYVIKNKILKKLSLKFKDKTFGKWKNGSRA